MNLRLRYALADSLVAFGRQRGRHRGTGARRSECAKNYLRLDPYSEQHLRETLALSYLRLGEQQNCSLHHNEHSCIFPLESTGIHTDKTGAQGAARELTARLKADPNNLQARWLLESRLHADGRLSCQGSCTVACPRRICSTRNTISDIFRMWHRSLD